MQAYTTLIFGNFKLDVFGTPDEPLVKCSDIIVRVLGYRDTSCAKWFDDMKTVSELVQQQQQMMFTLKGLRVAISKYRRTLQDPTVLAGICEYFNIDMPMQKQAKSDQQFIYVIHCDNLPFVKCGLSTDVKARIKSYQTSHWDIVTKRLYLVSDQQDLKSVESQCFAFLVDQGCEQKREMFRPQNITELDSILTAMDAFMTKFA